MRILKWLKLSLLAVITTIATLACASCNLFSGGGSESGSGFTGFLKGAQTELEVGAEFNPKDYVDIVSDGDYTITISNGAGFEDDVTRSKGEETHQWPLGEYTITYVVESGEHEGTYTYTLKIVPPRLKVFYTVKDEDMIMRLNQPFNFAKYFQGLELDIRCYRNEYTISMESVVIGNVEFGQEDTRQVISLEGQSP